MASAFQSKRAARLPIPQCLPDKAFVKQTVVNRRTPRSPATSDHRARRYLLRQFLQSSGKYSRSDRSIILDIQQKTSHARLDDKKLQKWASESIRLIASASTLLGPSINSVHRFSVRNAFSGTIPLRCRSRGCEADRSSSDYAEITARAPEPCARANTIDFTTTPSHFQL